VESRALARDPCFIESFLDSCAKAGILPTSMGLGARVFTEGRFLVWRLQILSLKEMLSVVLFVLLIDFIIIMQYIFQMRTLISTTGGQEFYPWLMQAQAL
jgi:hypothetical protein